MDQLKEMGEFVRSASSTIEAPVVRRLKEAFASTRPQDQQSRHGQRHPAPRDGRASSERRRVPPSAAPAQPGAGPRAGGRRRTPRPAANGAAGRGFRADGAARRRPGRPVARLRPQGQPEPARPGCGPGRRGPPAAAGAPDTRIPARAGPRGPRSEPRAPGQRRVPRASPDRRGRRHPRGFRSPGSAARRVPPRRGPAPRHQRPGTPNPQSPQGGQGARPLAAPRRPRRGRQGARCAPAGGTPAARPGRAPRPGGPRVPVRGRVTTRSARPRPAWARPPRPGPRVPFPASRVVPASRPTAPAAQGPRVAPVPAGAGQAARAVRRPGAVRAPAGSRVHVPAVPGRAR